jgi:hypothetical protein
VLQLAFASMGALLAIRVAGNIAGWLLLGVGIGFAVSMLATAIAIAARTGAGTTWLTPYAAWTAFAAWPLAGATMISIGFIFPTGQPQSMRWGRVHGALLVAWCALYAAALVRPGPLLLFDRIDNPFGFGPDLGITWLGTTVPAVLTWQGVMTAFVGVAMVGRYREGDAIARAQFRWVLVAVAASALCVAVPSGAALLRLPAASLVLEQPVSIGIFALTCSLIPLAIGIAILRHRLYDIDRLISRGLAYGTLSVILGGVFALTAIGLGGLLATVGAGQGRSIVVPAATLLVLALFQPLRRRVQQVVDRRFDRERYDAERTVRALVERLRADVDLESVREDVLSVMGQTFRPTSASLWLRPTVRGGP